MQETWIFLCLISFLMTSISSQHHDAGEQSVRQTTCLSWKDFPFCSKALIRSRAMMRASTKSAFEESSWARGGFVRKSLNDRVNTRVRYRRSCTDGKQKPSSGPTRAVYAYGASASASEAQSGFLVCLQPNTTSKTKSVFLAALIFASKMVDTTSWYKDKIGDRRQDLGQVKVLIYGKIDDWHEQPQHTLWCVLQGSLIVHQVEEQGSARRHPENSPLKKTEDMSENSNNENCRICDGSDETTNNKSINSP